MRLVNLDRLRSPSKRIEAALVALGIVAAGVLGWAIAGKGAEVLAWPLLATAGFLVFLKPELGLLLMVGTFPIENVIVVFGGEVTFSRILALGVGAAWLAHRLVERKSWQPLVSTTLFKVTILFLGLVLASALWAGDPSAALDGLFQLLRLFLLSLMAMDLVRSWGQIDLLGKILVLSGCFASVLTVQQYFVGGLARAGEDIAGGGNATAGMLVTILPLAFYLVRQQGSRFWRAVGSLSFPLSLIAVAVTFSRQAYIVLVLVLALHVYHIVGRGSDRRWLLLVGAAGIIVLLLAAPVDRVRRRVETIVPYLGSGLVAQEETLSWNRIDLLRVGGMMFLDHPLLGVGYGNYEYQFRHYASRLPNGWLMGDTKDAHSSYMDLLAGLGIIGFVLWIGILGIALRNLALSWIQLATRRASHRLLLVQAVTYSLLAQVALGWTARPLQEKAVWFLLGLSVVVRRLVEQEESMPGAPVAFLEASE